VKLHFVLADTWVTTCAVMHENQITPYRKRIVTVELTPEQMQTIAPRCVGYNGSTPMFEELLEVILERDEEERNEEAPTDE